MLLLPRLPLLQEEGEGVELLLPLQRRVHRPEPGAEDGAEARADPDLSSGPAEQREVGNDTQR